MFATDLDNEILTWSAVEARNVVCFVFIAQCKNVRGLGKRMVVFFLFEKVRYSNERSTKFESIKQE